MRWPWRRAPKPRCEYGESLRLVGAPVQARCPNEGFATMWVTVVGRHVETHVCAEHLALISSRGPRDGLEEG
jgi:hypothetical protein